MAGFGQADMPFLEHLEELRQRLFKMALAVAIGVGLAFGLLFTKQIDIVALLSQPIQPYLRTPLMATHPSDLFDIVMSASITIGLVLASPVIVWQIWGFLSPALYGHEKKLVIPTLIGAAALFFAGMALAYVYVLPVTFAFLLGFQSAAVEVKPTVHEYMGFVISMCVAFGAVFEMPIIVLFLSAIGIVKPQFMAKFRRHALVGCLIAAALITPGSDPQSLILLTVPLYLLYELSIGLSRMVASRRARREQRIDGADSAA